MELFTVQLHNLTCCLPPVWIFFLAFETRLWRRSSFQHREVKAVTQSSRKTSRRSHEGQSEERGRKSSSQDWWEFHAICFSSSLCLSPSLFTLFLLFVWCLPCKRKWGLGDYTALLLSVWLMSRSVFHQLCGLLIFFFVLFTFMLFTQSHTGIIPYIGNLIYWFLIILRNSFYLKIYTLLLFIQKTYIESEANLSTLSTTPSPRRKLIELWGVCVAI